jgi:hypothetical protein
VRRRTRIGIGGPDVIQNVNFAKQYDARYDNRRVP